MWRFLTSNTTSHNRNASSAVDTSLQVLPCVSVDQVQHSHIERLLNRHTPLEHSQWSAMIIITNNFGCCICVFLIDLWQTVIKRKKWHFLDSLVYILYTDTLVVCIIIYCVFMKLVIKVIKLLFIAFAFNYF